MGKRVTKSARQRPMTLAQAQRKLERVIDNLVPVMTAGDVPPRARERVHHSIGKLFELLTRFPAH